MKKRTSIIFCALLALFSSCSNEDNNTDTSGSANGFQSIQFATRTLGDNVSTVVYDPELIDEMKGYYFVGGSLAEIYQDIKPQDDGQAVLEVIVNSEAKLYFVANASKYTDKENFTVGATTEDSFLATVITAEKPEADGKKPLLVGKLELKDKKNTQSSVTLKRGVARFDINITDDNVQVKDVKIAKLRKNAFLFEQETVKSPDTVEEGDVDLTIDTPLIKGEHEGLCYFYEQAGTGSTVTIQATIKNVDTELTATLPNTIKRNCIYTVTVSAKGATLEAAISVEEWEVGDTVEAFPGI